MPRSNSVRPAPLLLGVLASCALAGCTLGPDFESPLPQWLTPRFASHKIAPTPAIVPVAEPVPAAWWNLFHDPELTSLENRVLEANLDVRDAALRLAAARSELGIAQSSLMPVVNANANATREAQAAKGVVALLGGSRSPAASNNGQGGTSGAFPASSTSGLTQPFNLYQVGFDASWEVDLWGRVKRDIESSQASMAATGESGHGIMITARAELARDYIQLRGIQAQAAIVRDNLDTARHSLDLTQQRFSNGLTTDLDVANAAAQVATTQALLPNLRQQEEQQINALSQLLAEPPGALRAELQTIHPIPPVPPQAAIGVPSDLARRRPDIREAEARLHAATADVGVAVADFYPRFTISGSVALQALQPHNLGSWGARTFGVGPSLTIPIFEGGKLTRTLELRQTEQQEAALAYQRTVLGALHEVDNALIACDAEAGRRTALDTAVTQSRRALDLARDRYEGGVIDYLSVLDAERRLLANQQQLNDSTTQMSVNLVQLYKALGGGWDDTEG